MEEIHARQKFVAGLEARNYQTRAWNTLTHAGRLWRSGILAHDPRFDGPASVPIQESFTRGYMRPGATNEDSTPPNPARLNAPRNAVALAIQPIQEYNRANTGAPRIAVEQAMPAESGQLGYVAAQASLNKAATEKARAIAELTEKEEKQLQKEALKASIKIAKLKQDKTKALPESERSKEEGPSAPADTTAGENAKEAALPAVPDPASEPVIVNDLNKLHAQIMEKLTSAGAINHELSPKIYKQQLNIAAKEVAALLIQYDNLRTASGKDVVNNEDLNEFATAAKSAFVSGAPNGDVGTRRWTDFDTHSGIARSRKTSTEPFRKWLGFGAFPVKRKSSDTHEVPDELPAKRVRRNSHDSAMSMENKLLKL
jgi:hypothetical protein